MQEKISRYVFQAMIGLVFGYFGTKALLNPEMEAAIWISQFSARIIESLLPLSAFMYILGTAEVAVAIMLVLNRLTKVALLVASALLAGIIINLGWNELALRDLVILSGTLYLFFSDRKTKPEDELR